MKAKETTPENREKELKSVLLSLVASKLKDRVLFPRKLEDAKKYLSKARLVHK